MRHRVQATMYSCLEPVLHPLHGSFEPCFIGVPLGNRHGWLILSSLFPVTKGCPACGKVTLGPGVRDLSLDIAEWYSCCTVLSTPLPQDMAVIPTSSIAGQHVSGTTNGVPCITSLGTWVRRSPHASGASLESWVRDSSRSCGLMSSTCLLSHGAKATTCSDDCPALSCGEKKNW